MECGQEGRVRTRGEKHRIGWVVSTRDIPSDDIAICIQEFWYKSFESVVDVSVYVVPLVLGFNDSLVVSVNKKGGSGMRNKE